MIPIKVDSVMQRRLTSINPVTEGEVWFSKGDFVGIVQPHESRYNFLVRDMRREQPTIHGFGIDFPHAVTAVSQLLDALTA